MKKIITISQYSLPILIGIFFIVYFLNKFDEEQKNQILNSLKNAEYSWIALSIMIGLLSHFIRAIRWKIALKPLGYNPKNYNLFFAVMTCYMANLAFPRLGDIARCTMLAKYENYSFNKVLGTVISERIIDLIFLGISFLIVIFFQSNEITKFFEKTNIDFFSSETILKLFFLIAGFVFLIIIILKLIEKSSNPILTRLTSFVTNIANGIKSIWEMERKFTYIIYTFAIWILYVLLFYVCIFSLPETTEMGFAGSMTCFLFGAIAIILTNGGLGAYPVLIAQAGILYGLSEISGYTLGWIVWSGQTIMILVFGLLSLSLFPLLNKKNA